MPATASKNRQAFAAVLDSRMSDQPDGGAERAGGGETFVRLADNPALRPLLAANGGFGLGAATGGFLETEGTLMDICRTLAGLAGGAAAGRRPGLESALARLSPSASGPGGLAARFESGGQGAAAIGYDEVGGTSYGLYQIASEPGTMDSFLGFLDRKAPALAGRLRAAGPANTGGRDGEMPRVWRQIAAEEPAAFAGLQRDFIRETHYDPALRSIREQTGLDLSRQHPAIQEVLWSTAVQHGPAGAARLFGTALARLQEVGQAAPDQPGRAPEAGLIDEVYAARSGQFGSSTSRVRAAVVNRFRTEKDLALSMLGAEQA